MLYASAPAKKAYIDRPVSSVILYVCLYVTAGKGLSRFSNNVYSVYFYFIVFIYLLFFIIILCLIHECVNCFVNRWYLVA